MPCLGSKFGLSGLSAEGWIKGSVPNPMVDTAERRRRALEARLSSFNFCRSAREIPFIRSGITDKDGVVNELVSEIEDVVNDVAKLDVSEGISGVEVAAVTVILAPCSLDIV